MAIIQKKWQDLYHLVLIMQLCLCSKWLRNLHLFHSFSSTSCQTPMSSLEDLFGKLAMTTVNTVSRIAISHATNAAIVSFFLSLYCSFLTRDCTLLARSDNIHKAKAKRQFIIKGAHFIATTIRSQDQESKGIKVMGCI